MRKRFITLIICAALTGTGLMGGTIKSGNEWVNPLRAILGIESVKKDKEDHVVEKTTIVEGNATKKEDTIEEIKKDETSDVAELVVNGQAKQEKVFNKTTLDNDVTLEDNIVDYNINEASKDNDFSVELLRSNRTSRVYRPSRGTVRTKPSVTPAQTPNVTPIPNKSKAVVTNTPTPIPSPAPKATPTPIPTPAPSQAPIVRPATVKPSTEAVTSDANLEAKVEQLIFNRVNAERSKAGMSQLSYNSTMEKYARIKSKDMSDRGYFDHKNPEGQLITVQMAKDGVSFTAWGENIAYIGGISDANAIADKFMTNWMNSSGHRANILSSKFTSLGVGIYKSGNKYYATQEFYK
ncbi:SCP-like extracellular protein [Clostridium putrefaciens]|uniref:SCP-like extracellular protein n=1 Tax=Clostridium putrefaciens TaxID=99675 RepID=A0A381JA36_9CLOT|nr:CAP domain-containing protein [Clostridium putrefaciens]SUY47598.1 SCP-like extracellular protein [Clostridium putrefaciens]